MLTTASRTSNSTNSNSLSTSPTTPRTRIYRFGDEVLTIQSGTKYATWQCGLDRVRCISRHSAAAKLLRFRESRRQIAAWKRRVGLS